MIFTIAATGISVAYADVSAYQDNTPEEKIFLELRSAGEWVSYTVDIGITWLSHPLVEAVYAEEQVESREFIPFPFQQKEQGWGENKTSWIIEYFPIPKNQTENIKIIKNGTDTIPDVVDITTNSTKDPEPPTEPEKPKKPEGIAVYDDFKEALEDKCAKGKCTPKEIKFLDEIDTLEYCYDGDNTSIGIQSANAFVHPKNVTYSVTDNEDLKTNPVIKDMRLNDQRCKADKVLDETIHNVSHEHKYTSDFNPLGKEVKIPLWRANFTHSADYSALNEHDFAATNQDAQDKICKNHLFGNAYKEQQHCPKEDLYVPTECNTCKYDGIETQHNPMFDENTNPSWKAMQKYKNSNGTIALEGSTKIEEQKAINHTIESFANQNNIDVNALKAWMDSQK